MIRGAALALLAGCAVPEPSPNPLDPEQDFDGDGLDESDGDCDDQDPTLGEPFVHYPDEDGDGEPSMLPAEGAGCLGSPTAGTDCDDADPSVPSAELCWTSADEDCSGLAEACALQGVVQIDEGIPLPLPDAAYTYNGVRPFAGGDLDGDGAADIGLGMNTNTTVYDRVRIVLGPPQSPTFLELDLEPTDYDTQYPDRATHGAILDFDGDGLDDLFVAAYDGSDARFLPSMWLLFGPRTAGATLDLGAASPDVVEVLADPNPGDDYAQQARALASGDLNGDGLEDLVIGAPTWNEGTSYLAVVEGEPGRMGPIPLEGRFVPTPDSDDLVGLGDGLVAVDGVGCPDGAGVAAVTHGYSEPPEDHPAEAVLLCAVDLLNGQIEPLGRWASDLYTDGSTATSIAWYDLDGSGAEDLAFGAGGAAHVIFDPQAGTSSALHVDEVPSATIDGSGLDPTCGEGLAAVPDLFGPGVAGLAFGCPDNAATAFLFPGPDLVDTVIPDDAYARIVGETATGQVLVDAGGDLDGDGGADLIVGTSQGAFLLSGGLAP